MMPFDNYVAEFQYYQLNEQPNYDSLGKIT